MKTIRFSLVLAAAIGCASLLADEGMWRLDQLPLDVIAAKYGVRLTPADIQRLQSAPVRLLSGGGGGTGTFASANGLILTNHHVALDCIRTSTLAEQNQARADNLIENGFTAAAQAEELPCKRFRAQIERSATDVTADINAGVTPNMAIADMQRVRQAARSALERTCTAEKGTNFSCAVVDFNSGARSLLIVYEDFKDIRLVYAPEKQLGYFGGDEMNFRFPRYVSDISILRAYLGKDGSHTEFDAAHVPYRPEHFLRVTMAGVKEGDFTLVAGNPGNTNRYRESYSADYNLRKGIPDQIRDLETQLGLLRKYAGLKPEYEVILQSQIFSLANTLKYQQDVLAALAATKVVADRQQREREFTAFLETRPEVKKEFGGVLQAQSEVYANDVEANAALDAALNWLQRVDTVSLAVSLNEFATERAKTSDRDREPQFQERNWPDMKEALLNDDPIIPELEEDVLTVAFERALALKGAQQIPAVQKLAARVGAGATARSMVQAVLKGSQVASLETRKRLIDAAPGAFSTSEDPTIMFARDLQPSLLELRQRVRILNEKLLKNRSGFARGLAAWKGASMYPDANFTLRATYGRVAGYTDRSGKAVPFTTKFDDMLTLSKVRGNTGDFAIPSRLATWRQSLGDPAFAQKYAALPVNFVTTNDITGGNSGSATLNRSLEIVGLIFDGNEEAMAGDWTYSEGAGRALSTDIRFALTIARDVHGAGWIVDELLAR
jgi:peptidase S46-like protein